MKYGVDLLLPKATPVPLLACLIPLDAIPPSQVGGSARKTNKDYTGGTLGMSQQNGTLAPKPGFLAGRIVEMPEMHAASMPDPSRSALGLPGAVMPSMAHAHPAVAPRAPDAHERAIIERILAEKAVQLEATHDHLVANLAMYQPPQPPPAAHSSSQYFCQR